jgi:hypothetical protein
MEDGASAEIAVENPHGISHGVAYATRKHPDRQRRHRLGDRDLAQGISCAWRIIMSRPAVNR